MKGNHENNRWTPLWSGCGGSMRNPMFLSIRPKGFVTSVSSRYWNRRKERQNRVEPISTQVKSCKGFGCEN